jgi:hypothetical protein
MRLPSHHVGLETRGGALGPWANDHTFPSHAVPALRHAM